MGGATELKKVTQSIGPTQSKILGKKLNRPALTDMPRSAHIGTAWDDGKAKIKVKWRRGKAQADAQRSLPKIRGVSVESVSECL